jgi:hypothetical protein
VVRHLQSKLFTSADNSRMAQHTQGNPGTALLLLAAGLAPDTIYEEA